MRHTAFRLRAFSALLVALPLSCRNADPVAPEPEQTHIMRASINGVAFVGESELYAAYYNNILAIAARAPDKRTIHLTVRSDFRADTVDIGEGSQDSAIIGFENTHWRSNLAGGSGRVIITRANNFEARGSFEFTAVPDPNTGAKGKRVVTGTFAVELGFTSLQMHPTHFDLFARV